MQGRPEACVFSGQVNNLAPVRTNTLKLYWPRAGLLNFLKPPIQITDN